METLVKWFGIGAIIFALAPLGPAVRLPATRHASSVELGHLFPSGVGSDDVSAWVLEANNPPSPQATARVSRSGAGFGPSVANRNSNPLNLKLGSATRRYVDVGLATISGILPRDGGRFLKFDSPETGFRAAVDLLRTPGYHDLKLDRALRRWSNNGYGGEILAGTSLDADKPIPNLGRDDLRVLLHVMVAAEGYRSSRIGDEISRALRR